MAVAIPLIASFASASATVLAAESFAAAMSTVSGFLSIAGAALTTVGALTGKKDLMKIGGFMSLGGGIGTAMNAAGTAATEGAASGAWDAAGSGSGSDAAQFAKYAQQAAPAANDAAGALASLSPEMLADGATFGLTANDIAPGIQQGAETAQAATDPYYKIAAERASRGGDVTKPSLWDTAAKPPALDAPAVPDVPGRIAEAGASMPWSELQTLLKTGWDKAGQALTGAGDFARGNTELVNLGGNMLSSMYGPQAEMMDFKKSIYQRQMANLNSPVKLTYNRGR